MEMHILYHCYSLLRIPLIQIASVVWITPLCFVNTLSKIGFFTYTVLPQLSINRTVVILHYILSQHC